MQSCTPGGCSSAPKEVHTLPSGIEKEIEKGIENEGSDEPSHPRRCSSAPSESQSGNGTEMPNRDDRLKGCQVVPGALNFRRNVPSERSVNERFWHERLERHRTELEACTDKKRREELEAAIARAVRHLGGVMARGAA
jgi:hypothetical protein